jgi:hypothetical protein
MTGSHDSVPSVQSPETRGGELIKTKVIAWDVIRNVDPGDESPDPTSATIVRKFCPTPRTGERRTEVVGDRDQRLADTILQVDDGVGPCGRRRRSETGLHTDRPKLLVHIGATQQRVVDAVEITEDLRLTSESWRSC